MTWGRGNATTSQVTTFFRFTATSGALVSGQVAADPRCGSSVHQSAADDSVPWVTHAPPATAATRRTGKEPVGFRFIRLTDRAAGARWVGRAEDRDRFAHADPAAPVARRAARRRSWAT